MLGRRGREAELEERLEHARQRIGALESRIRSIQAVAGRDPLTGRLDRAAMRSRVEAEISRARRSGAPLSLALLDLDGFRALNAHHGQPCGDEVLRAVARVLRASTREHDVIARPGADEFAVVLPDTPVDGALQCFERTLLELEATTVGAVTGLSASIGIAVWERGLDADVLLARAGEGVDRARAAGGGRVVVSSGAPGTCAEAAAPSRQLDAVAGLASALLERDRYTGEHSESVVEMVEGVARNLGLGPEETERVKMAALLHDIGKVAIPDSILNKEGPLDDEEWKLMRDHTVIGERILRAIPGLGGVARIVRHEHERWDGGGYPDGIAGEQIPIGSRIILACDAYHAMTSDRPYRAAMSHGEAIEELAKSAGTQFDPRVTEALIGALYGSRGSRAAA